MEFKQRPSQHIGVWFDHGVEVQVKVVADGEEQVVLQTNVEIMRCNSGVKDAERL